MNHLDFLRLLLCLSPLCPGSTSATTYYVAPNGDDSHSGSPSEPWQTIQHAADLLLPGDTALIRGGIYHELLRTVRDGTAQAPIVFAAYPGETPALDGTGITESGNGIIVAHSFILLQGLEIRNWESCGIWVVQAGYLQISDCEVHDVSFGIGLAEGTHDFALNRVHLHHFTGFGVDASPSGGADCYNGTFNDCVAHTGRDPSQNVDGFALGHGAQHGFVFNRCETYGVFDGFDISARDTTLYCCSAHHCWQGGYKLWQDNITLVNCLSYSNATSNVELDWAPDRPQPKTVTLQNCTLLAAGDGTIWVENSADSLHLFNCILAGGLNKGLTFEQMGVTNYRGDYNIFHNADPDRAVVVGYTDEFSLSQIAAGSWTAYSGQDQHSLVATNPATQLFRDLSRGDLHLCQGSLAINAGASTADAPTNDFDGVLRSSGVDIGAFEFVPTNNLVAPLLACSLAGGALEIRWLSQPGLTYQVQASDDLSAWTDVGSPLDGTGGLLISTPLATSAMEALFFRVNVARRQIP